MQKITTHLWYDKEARQAAEFYVSIFPDSAVRQTTTIHNTPSGDTEIVNFEILGREFQAISAGPYFKFNPSVSLHVICKTAGEVDAIWNKLSDGGRALMELGDYPFSPRYGWLEDKYGLSWQVGVFPGTEARQKVTPVIMFVGKVCGRAEEAINFWAEVFRESRVGDIQRYGQGDQPDKEGTVKYGTFLLFGQEFGAMDSAHGHMFEFNEAISFVVKCDSQEEIDYYWEKLSAVPQAEQCGWLKDKFGFSWQIVPRIMDEMMSTTDDSKLARVTGAFLKMKKFDIAELERAAKG